MRLIGLELQKEYDMILAYAPTGQCMESHMAISFFGDLTFVKERPGSDLSKKYAEKIADYVNVLEKDYNSKRRIKVIPYYSETPEQLAKMILAGDECSER
jgi:hypothetical protein